MVDPNNSFGSLQHRLLLYGILQIVNKLLNGLKPEVVILDVQPQINVLLLLTVALIHLVTLS